MFTALFRRLCSRNSRTPRKTPMSVRRSFRPRLEALEDRTVPSTFNVTNLLDSGTGSLRAAIASANANPGADTVAFAPALTGTITLKTGQLNITGSLTIQGPGADALTVSGNNASRVFNVAAGTTDQISGLTITNGYMATPGNGGAGIHNLGSLTLTNVAVKNNFAQGMDIALGGGIFNSGTLTIQNSTITGNSAGYTRVFGPGDVGSVTGLGGGIYNVGALTVQNSTLSGNTAGGWGLGGAVMNGAGLWVGIFPKVWKGASATFTGCTITGNSATTGGGIYVTSTGSALTALLNASATTLLVQSAAYFVTGQTIQIDNEQMTVTKVDTLRNTLTVTRGVNNTTAAAHLSGARVMGLSTCLDAFTLAHLIDNSAPSNANIYGLYLTCP